MDVHPWGSSYRGGRSVDRNVRGGGSGALSPLSSPAVAGGGSIAAIDGMMDSRQQSAGMTSKEPHFPMTPAEQAELETIAAQSSGPDPVYAWIFGSEHELTKLVANETWESFEVKNGREGLPKLLEGLKQYQFTENGGLTTQP